VPTIRLGLLSLPLAGLLLTWGAIATSAFFDFPDPVVGPEEAARASTSLGYFLSQFVGYVGGLTLLTVGVFALTLYLSEFRRERWTLLAMVLRRERLPHGAILHVVGDVEGVHRHPHRRGSRP
jgi:hypothetical protein